MTSKSVVVIGGGLAGLSSAVALAEAGFRVQLLERLPHLGGRATSYWLPGGEHVDNCQHVTLGCCTNLSDFYRRVGVEDKIRYYDRMVFLDSRGRRGIIRASPLPPPFHLAPSFFWFPSLRWPDKFAIARAMLRILRSAGRPADADGISMLEWLSRNRQTENAIQRFWRVVLVSALDEELDRSDARYGVQVFWKAFLASRTGFRIGIPAVPLAELYDGCREAIERRGGEVRTRAPARALLIARDAVEAVVLDDGTRLESDYVVSAVPHDVLAQLVAGSPVSAGPYFAGLARLCVSPITGVHFWFDRTVMEEPFLALLERTVQWIFNKTLLSDRQAPSGQYLQLVISASYDLVNLSRQQIIDLCRDELRAALPSTRQAELRKATVIKEVAATFSPRPGCDRWRPPPRGPVANLILAGDWIQTGWPSTMESAVRSGYLAAEAILALEGTPNRVVVPDLPVEGLARFWLRE